MKLAIQGVLLMSALGILVGSPVEFDTDTAVIAPAAADSTYRLSKNVLPSKYELELTPYFANETGKTEFTFDGTVKITLRAMKANVQSIVLHKNDLDILSYSLSGAIGIINGDVTLTSFDELRDFWTIELGKELPINEDSFLTITYVGYMRDDMSGFYKSYYKENGQRVYMASTQLQSTDARRAFPCFDEPGIKAVFKVTMNRPKAYNTVSNTMLESTIQGLSRDTDIFHETPVMSTYLLAFIVSKYQGRYNAASEDLRTYGVYARPDARNFSELGLNFGQEMLKQFGTYLDYDYYSVENINKMDMAAIPDFSAGAMENWGLLTYRETNVLYYPDDTASLSEQRIVAVIAHEQAHMWFGDLVTCSFWSETWLNEGFARYFQYFGTAMINGYADWDLEEQFVVENLQQSMQLDSTEDTHPMTDNDVSTKAQASSIFDNISYNKASSIIRMLKHFITAEKFEETLQHYLKTNEFKAVVPANLFTAIDTVNPATPSVTEDFWAAWTATPGFPLVTVKRSSNVLTLNQKRFMRLDEGNTKTEQYNIPINIAIDSDDYKNTTADFLFRIGTSQMNYTLHKTPVKYYILNKQQTGFYRINYDEENWNQIKEALMTENHDGIHVLNRAQVVDDLFNLARAGIVQYETAVNVISYLKTEKSYIPWLAAFNNGLTFLSQRVSGDSNQALFAWFILDLTEEIYEFLKFDQPATAERRTNIYNRVNIQNWACKYGHDGCIEKSKEHFNKFMNEGTKVAKNQRPTVYCNAVRNGNSTNFDFLYNKFLQEDIAAELLNLLAGMACTKDQTLLNKYLDLLIVTDEIRPQDRTSTINNVLNSNPEGPQMLYNYISTHVDSWKAKMGNLNTLTSVASRFTTESQFTAYENFLKIQETALGADVFKSLNTGLNDAKKLMEWDAKYMKAFMDHLEKLKSSGSSRVISILVTMISLTALYILN